MSMMKCGYSYDVYQNILTLSESFAKKASKMGSAEYRILLQFRKDCPGLKVEKTEGKGKSGKHAKLTYSDMEGFIKQCRDADKRMAEYKRMRSLAELQASPFMYMKTWFLNNYANYAEQGQLDEDNYFVPKTKEQMEAEKKVAAERMTNTEDKPVEAAAEKPMLTLCA